MGFPREIGRMVLVLFLTVFLVAFLWQVPYFLALLLLLPLGLSVWFWPYASTGLSYIVGALVGTLFTAWSLVGSVKQPQNMPVAFIWLPLVWGPAGVLVKRMEVLVVAFWQRKKYVLPELK